MAVTSKNWGKCPATGAEITLYRITNAHGAYVELSNVGAGIVSVVVPDRDGKMDDVTIGYPVAESYFGDGPCSGKTPGRYANRIAKGTFTLDGKEYHLPINNGPNALHGGPEGFCNQVWDSREFEGGVEFCLVDEDGHMGYPGTVKVIVRYEWTDANELMIAYHAETDAPTVINLTNHAYWNLNGEGNGDILGHEMTINAAEYLPTDDTQIPLGDAETVSGTPMDFVNPKKIGRDINADFLPLKIGKGYDHCWVIDDYCEGELAFAASLYAPESGRELKVYTTQPGIQVYTGNWLSGCPEGKNGHVYTDYCAVALECQHYPDCPNKEDYPSTRLNPGEEFNQLIVYAFSNR